MPELPEVEIIRSGLCRYAAGKTIRNVEILDIRSVRYDAPHDFIQQLKGKTLLDAQRRGKFLWLPLAEPSALPESHEKQRLSEEDKNSSDKALLIHLGMSGQALFSSRDTPDQKHLKVRLALSGTAEQLRFVDQRIFGYASLEKLRPDLVGSVRMIPERAAHIAADPLEDAFDAQKFVTVFRSSKRTVKRLLLDQRVVSGIGNIYADEALWAAKIHYNTPANTLGEAQLVTLIEEVKVVMRRAIAQGGTSFDSLYVNVNGSSGYFSRSLNVYGREGEPCSRHTAQDLAAEREDTVIKRDSFMNRSSFYCSLCQKICNTVT